MHARPPPAGHGPKGVRSCTIWWSSPSLQAGLSENMLDKSGWNAFPQLKARLQRHSHAGHARAAHLKPSIR